MRARPDRTSAAKGVRGAREHRGGLRWRWSASVFDATSVEASARARPSRNDMASTSLPLPEEEKAGYGAGPIAVVLGLTVNGLGVLRSLGTLGVPCVGIYKGRRDYGRRSRYLRRSLRLDAGASDDEIEAALRELTAATEAKPVLIPTEDRYAQFVAWNQEALRERYVVRCPPRDLFDAFLDKAKTIELCQRHGLVIPASRVLGTRGAVEEAMASMRFPAIVKPRLTFDQGFPGKNFIAETPEALALFFDRRPQLLGGTVIQEVVPSGDGHILVVATYSGEDGRVLGIYTGRKLRQFLPDYGVTTFGVSESHPELARATRSFLEGIGYRGFAALEFARDRLTGQISFLELNARTYYHNRLFADAGVDLTRIGWDEMVGSSERSEMPAQRDGVHWLDFARDLRSFYRKRRQGAERLGGWLRSLLKTRSFAVFDVRDVGPALLAAGQLVADIVSHVVHRDADDEAAEPGDATPARPRAPDEDRRAS
jgi:D-aspartate ligase